MCIGPLCLVHIPSAAEDIGLPVESSPRQPNRYPCGDAFHPPRGWPARSGRGRAGSPRRSRTGGDTASWRAPSVSDAPPAIVGRPPRPSRKRSPGRVRFERVSSVSRRRISTSGDLIRRRRWFPAPSTLYVDPATVNPADLADAVDAEWLLLDGHALRDELADGGACLFVVAAEEARPPRTGEHAPPETGQNDALSPSSGLARISHTGGRRTAEGVGIRG